MYTEEIGESIIFRLKNLAYLRFDYRREYTNIVSPFSRIYLITEGHGTITIGHEQIELKPGYIYLIPGFTLCSYIFEQGLCHYYIHVNEIMQNGLNIFNLYKVKNKIIASDIIQKLFERLLYINPDLQLPHHDPKVYQTKPWINQKVHYKTINQHLESIGIIRLIFSSFLEPEQSINATNLLQHNMQAVLLHIQDNLQNDISMNELSGMACLSKDHFTRLFKSLVGIPPCEFIIRKRIEKAQFLLLTTNMSQEQIIEKTNFKSLSYFSRMFKKYTSFTPTIFRQQK
ncbi:MAG: helix-turn-helix transcriptional regulator [Bacteroidetes bacterium]|nr:helix-turn-helix transcriptional regulator [Bacteroidota bacterium]